MEEEYFFVEYALLQAGKLDSFSIHDVGVFLSLARILGHLDRLSSLDTLFPLTSGLLGPLSLYSPVSGWSNISSRSSCVSLY